MPTLAQQEAAGQTVAKSLGCPGAGARCLYKLSAVALNVLNPLTNLTSVSPNVDGVTIPMGPAPAFAAGKFQHIPVINGSTLKPDVTVKLNLSAVTGGATLGLTGRQSTMRRVASS